jgi:hypothetical protein
MSADALGQFFRTLRLDNSDHLGTCSGDVPAGRTRVLVCLVFCYFYLPLIYWYGWGLHATQVVDYPGYYLAAHNVFIDRITPYGFNAFDRYAEEFGRWMPPYIYPPPSILAFWPLTFLSFANAFIAFTLISHLCLLGSLWLIITRIAPLPRHMGLRTAFVCFSIAYVLSFNAVQVTLLLGQINLIVLFLICASLAAIQSRGPAWRIAVPLSFAILIKTYPIFLLILLVARRRYKAAVLAVTYLGVIIAVAAVVVPTYVWASWLTEIVPAASSSKELFRLFSHTPLDFTWNQSIAGFLKRLLGDTIWGQSPLSYPGLARPLTGILDAVVIALTSFWAFRFYKHANPGDRVTDDMAAFLLMIYLIAPISWDHHLVFVLPALIAALGLILQGTIRGKTAFAVAVTVVMLAWRYQMDAHLFKKHWWMLLGFAQLYAVAALWIFFLFRLARASSSAPEHPAIPALSHSLQPQI